MGRNDVLCWRSTIGQPFVVTTMISLSIDTKANQECRFLGGFFLEFCDDYSMLTIRSSSIFSALNIYHTPVHP
jgi:hypothetical protein